MMDSCLAAKVLLFVYTSKRLGVFLKRQGVLTKTSGRFG